MSKIQIKMFRTPIQIEKDNAVKNSQINGKLHPVTQ